MKRITAHSMRTESVPVKPPSVLQIQILSQVLVDNENIPSCIHCHTELLLTFNSLTYSALLDRRSSICNLWVSLQLYKNDPTYKQIPFFPHSGIILSTDLNCKIMNISKQIFLEFKINNHQFNVVLLVIPSLLIPSPNLRWQLVNQ